MASSSRSSPQPKHDVFLNFRGQDTRKGFVSHIQAALRQKQVETFTDDELVRGKEISGSLLNAIEGSKISVVIFSKGYASSRWCLDELVKILECKEKYGQLVIPVFYGIDPSHVRNQTGTFAKAFAKHEDRFKKSLEKVQRWRVALNETANLSGFDSNVSRSEFVLIEDIIKDILKKLDDMSHVDNKNLVGIDMRIKDVVLSLRMELVGVCKVGIWGIGGIGKTTLACAVFDKVFKHFEVYYFAQDVKEAWKTYSDRTHLREELLFKILGDEHANVKFTSTKEKLSRRKVLIVFDDVTSVNQIEELIGDLEFLGSGSRILVTTRDRQVLKNCGVDQIHEIGGLSDNDALQLFSRYAFKGNRPTIGYMDLSNRVIAYAQGLPLALKVLGSLLFDRPKEYWENALDKLKIIPNSDIQKVLKVSYDGLDYEDQKSFLHISCFFRGRKTKFVKEILDASGLYPGTGIDVLIERSLISISYDTIIMHDLIQDMGREVVRQESIDDPGKRSRLWRCDDICCVLSQNTGTEAIQGISVDISEIEDIYLSPHAFSKMHIVRFFEVLNTYSSNKLHNFDRLGHDFSELRYFYWHQYPFKSLPPNFHARNLVALEMPDSNVEQIWTGVQNLSKLKRVNLRDCKHLLRIPDFSQASNLENLSLQGCTSLHETPSIWYLNKVVTLNLTDCKSLHSSPTQIHSKSLREVIFSGCSSLKMVPKLPCTVKELYLNGTSIKELPSSIGSLSDLEVLNLEHCSRLESLSNDIFQLKSLRILSLSGCTSLQETPSIWYLNKVVTLDLTDCKSLSSSPTQIQSKSLRKVIFSGCSSLEMVPKIPCGVQEFYLNETPIKTLPSSLGCVTHLKVLSVENCSRLESLSNAICKLKSLEILRLSGCSRLRRLPDDLGNLEALKLFDVNGSAIRELPASIASLKKLRELSLQGFKIQESFDFLSCTLSGLRCLTTLNLSDCGLTELPNSFNRLFSLTCLNIGGNNFTGIPTSILSLSKLWKLIISHCNMLQSLPELPFHLEYVEAVGCTSLQAVPSSLNLSLLRVGTYATKFSFFNCPKLDWNGLRNHLDDAPLNHQENRIRFAGVHEHNYLIHCISFPGSEIPEWFSFQGAGSYILLPPGSLNRNVVGLACIVVKFMSPLSLALLIHCNCLAQRQSGDYQDVTFRSLKVWHGDMTTLHIESDHIVVGYFYTKGIPEWARNSSIIINFEILSPWCKVKKCGFHLFDNQDRRKSSKSVEKEEEVEGKPRSRSLKVSNVIGGEPCASSYFISGEEEGKGKKQIQYFKFISDEKEEEEGEPQPKRLKISNAIESEPCTSSFISKEQEEEESQDWLNLSL